MTAPRKPQDRTFSKDVARFQKNIYDTAKGQIRKAVLAHDLAFLIDRETPLKVLDIGAGLGQVNQLFAQAGHHVTHTDIAPEMVAAAREVHDKAGLSSCYQYIVSSLQELPEKLGGMTFDVVLCHAVFEWLAEPSRALAVIKPMLNQQGWLSLMFYNRRAKEMANLIYGNFDYVRADFAVKKKVRFSPQTPLNIESVKDWALAQQLTLYRHSGVRCIHDYLRDLSHQSRDDLIEMELHYRNQEPFRQFGRYQHFVLRNDMK